MPLFAWLILRDHFGVPMLVAFSVAAPVLIRPPMIVAIAALVILLTRARRPADAADRRRRPRRLQQLSRHLAPDDRLFYGWGFGLFGASQPHPALAPGGGDVGADAALVEALARPLQLRPVRMAVAQPRPLAAAADAKAGAGGRLEPPEFLVARLLAEAAARRWAERVGLFLEQRHRSSDRAAAAWRPRARCRPGRGAISSARRQAISICSARSASGSAPNWRASAFIVWAGRTIAGGVLAVHRILDLRDRLSRHPRGNSRGCARNWRRARSACARIWSSRRSWRLRSRAVPFPAAHPNRRG